MKRLLLLVGGLLCLFPLWAQQPEEMGNLRVAPRANVIAYDDENGVEHLRYTQSPYYLSVSEDWEIRQDGERNAYSQLYEFPKHWRDYRVYFRYIAPSGYGLYLDEQLVGISHDSKSFTEFDLTSLIRFGRSHTLALRYVGEDDGTLLDAPSAGVVREAAILLKPLQNVQDYTLLTQYDPASETGIYTLEANLYNQRRKGKCYLEVELWDPKGKRADKLGKWCFFDQHTEASHSLSSTLANVLPWSADAPRLYTAVIRLYDEKMTLQEVVGTRFGFRTIAYKDRLTVNGQAITLKGITFAAPTGPITPEREKALRAQLVQMKCNNINAIRTCADSPFDERFYELCDELGFYVVADANLHPQSDRGRVVAADNEYADLFAARVQNLYGQYKNHPCIVAWSLGESPDNGVCMTAAYKALRHADPQRPVLYAGALYADNTDLIAPLQANADLLRQHLAKTQTRPLVMLSYGSTEGNTFGGMQPLWQIIRDHEGLQGGFLRCDRWADFAALPYAEELRQLYTPIAVRMLSTSPDAAEFEIANPSDFRALSDYRLDYVICSNLKPNIVAGDISLSIKPGETRTERLKVPHLTLYAGEELCIRFTLRQRGSTASIPKNTVLYTAQFPLPSDNMARQPLSEVGRQPLHIERDSLHSIQVIGHDFVLHFDDSLGLITSLTRQGQPLLTKPLRLDFMRPPSPSDRVDPNGLRQWQRSGLDDMQCQVLATNVRPIDPYTVGIDIMMRYSSHKTGNLFDVRQTCWVLHTGDILLHNDITVAEQVKSIARVGLSLGFAKGLDTVEYFGRTTESYPDRQSAGQIAQQSVPVSALQYRYPTHSNQHAGNHTQVRWLSLRNSQIGLYADILDTLCHFSLRADTLSIDYRMTGTGGAIGGMNLDESVLVKDRHYRFTLHLRPYDCMENDAHDFRRIAYPQVVSGIIEMPVISSNRARFDGPMQITLQSPTRGAEIRYTLDGSLPTEKSPLYTRPFTLQGSTLVQARAFKKGETPSFVASRQFVFDYVVACTFAHKPNTPYNKNADRALFDGQLGDVNDLSHGWLGFSGHDVQVTLQLSQPVNPSRAVLRFAHVPDAWVFAPAQVAVSLSADGQEYSAPVSATITYDPSSEEMNTTQLQVLSIPLNGQQVRYVRIEAKPLLRIPEWHRAKGLKPWIMMDEISIE